MKKSKLFAVDLDVYKEAVNDLVLYYEMIMMAHKEAIGLKLDPEMVEDLAMQADMVNEIVIKFKTSVANGSKMPIGNSEIH